LNHQLTLFQDVYLPSDMLVGGLHSLFNKHFITLKHCIFYC